tara:strand:+ start:212 stop:850 length:639 start_codon:yes stop_codon:yes gene_type:complete
MKNKSYVISSLGRCGSTLLTEAIHKEVWGYSCPKEHVSDTHEFIVSQENVPSNFAGGKVYKTHIRPVDFPSSCKVIFTFGDPVNIIVSLMQKSNENYQWGWQHFQNLGAAEEWENREDIIEKDILKLENMFDEYYKEQNFDLMCLKYEDFWEPRIEEDISDFLGFKFKMPERKNRHAHQLKEFLVDDSLEILEKTYSSLSRKVNSAQSISFW